MSDTSSVTSTLDVLEKYNALVAASLGGDSAYIRAKETIQSLVTDGGVDDAKKAEVLSSIIGGMVNSITGSAMSSALEWAKYEKDLSLKKLELDQQLLILGNENLLKEAQADQVKTQTRLALVESKRMFGTGTFVNDALTSLDDTGKVFVDMEMVKQNTANAAVENDLLLSKIDESKVAIHKVVADTYVNFGSYTFTQDSNGISSVIPTHGVYTTLSDTQREIAVEQGKGYTYNAWANSLTGSASMLGTAIASGDFSFDAGSNELRLFDAVVACAENLKKASSTATEAVPGA